MRQIEVVVQVLRAKLAEALLQQLTPVSSRLPLILALDSGGKYRHHIVHCSIVYFAIEGRLPVWPVKSLTEVPI
jgi:hypothetical protein